MLLALSDPWRCLPLLRQHPRPCLDRVSDGRLRAGLFLVLQLFLVGAMSSGVQAQPIGSMAADLRLPNGETDPRNPGRLHIGLPLSTSDGRPVAPDVRFYARRDLSGPVSMQFDRHGLRVGDVVICTWSDGAFDTTSPRSYEAQLVSAMDPTRPCPTDVPIKPSRQRTIELEVTRLNGRTVEVRYRGTAHYMDLRTLPANPWGWEYGAYFRLPTTSPPLRGGVDIPRLFRPPTRQRIAVTLRTRPSGASGVVATLQSRRMLETFSLGQGAHVAAVYERANRWNLVRLIDGRTGWLAPEDAGKFVSFERLVRREQQTYMTAAWDGTLAREPGAERTISAPDDPRRVWIGYVPWVADQPLAGPVYASPDEPSEPLPADGREAFESIEVPAGSGQGGPIVFSRRPGWLEVGLYDSGSSYRKEGLQHVWIREDASRWTVRTVEKATAEAALMAAWGPPALQAVRVLESVRIRGVLWLRVRVLVGEACELVLSDLLETTLAEGWVPAHAASGRPVIWFETYCD